MDVDKAHYVEDSPNHNFILFFSSRLSKKQRSVLARLSELNGNKETMTSFVRKIPEVSEPTARRTFQLLRSLGFVECGSESSKGIPLKITEEGALLLKYINRGYGETSSSRSPEP